LQKKLTELKPRFASNNLQEFEQMHE